MQPGTPEVVEATLRLEQGGQSRSVPVGSPAWFDWLRTARTFIVRADGATFSARKQRQGAHWYWYAYARREGRLRCIYLGKSSGLSAARLEEVMDRLHPLPDVALPPGVAARFGCRSPVVRRAADYLLAAARSLELARAGSVDGESLRGMLAQLADSADQAPARAELQHATALDLVLTWALRVEGQRDAQTEALSILRRLLQEAQQHDLRLKAPPPVQSGDVF